MPEVRRCPRCGETKPRTAEHFFFHQHGPRAGQVTGYCRPCHRAYWHEYWATKAGPDQKDRHRTIARLWWRRRYGQPWSRFRVPA